MFTPVSTDDVPTGTQGLFREGVSQFTEVSRPSVPQCVTQDGTESRAAPRQMQE